MQVLMDESVTALAGPRGKHDPDRVAVRHGTEDGSVVLGGRQVPVRRPRVRTADRTAEVAVPAYELFASSELLGELALERMMAKLSTRRYEAGLEPVGSTVVTTASGTSRSAVSRRFVAMTERALDELMRQDLSALDLVALMIDGVHFAEHLCVVALGITIDGTKVPLGVVEGSTENATVVKALLSDLARARSRCVSSGLGRDRRRQGPRAAVREIFDRPVVQRCQLHKVRNVERHLPKAMAATVTKKMPRHVPRPRPAACRSDPRGTRPFARQGPSWCGRFTPGRTRRDAHRQPPRCATHVGENVAVDERDRIHDRDLPRPQLEREALARRADDVAVVRGRDARSRQAVPPRERLPPPRRAPRRARPTLRDDRHTHARNSGGRLTNTRAVTQVPRNTGHPQDRVLDRWIEWARRSRIPAVVTSNAASAHTAMRSTPPSTAVSRKASSNPPTPRSDCSPASRTASTPPTTRRPRHARPRRTPTTSPRTNMTHGNDRRAPYLPVKMAGTRSATTYRIPRTCETRLHPSRPRPRCRCRRTRDGASWLPRREDAYHGEDSKHTQSDVHVPERIAPFQS